SFVSFLWRTSLPFSGTFHRLADPDSLRVYHISLFFLIKGYPNLVLAKFGIPFFSVLLVQFGQHIVSSGGNGTFLPSGLVLPQRR
ncbi:hypothetical protein ACQP3D_28730, partial [Escherichia coli]